MSHWHSVEIRETVAALASDAEVGLDPRAARSLLERIGSNRLPEGKRRGFSTVFFSQFESPLIYLLLMAAGVAFALGHPSDGVVIFVVVVLNAVIGAVQEGRAENSLVALRKLSAQKARVIRGGAEAVVEARELVPGDLLVLEAGDAVTADARLLQGVALQVSEAALTGESVPVSKSLLALPAETPLSDRSNMLYAGTHVAAGRARAIVVATAAATEIGQIAALAETAKQPPTPLERRIARFGRHIMVLAATLFVAIVAIGWLRGMPLGEILMVGISQVVGIIPEGLPVAMTIALSVGVQRMARRKAVVRRLGAVEALGSTTIVCTDKTGTLTRNEMTVTTVHLPSGRTFHVTGIGYAPLGEIVDERHDARFDASNDLRELLEAAVLCNDARLLPPDAPESVWKPVGDPTEVALLTLAAKGGVDAAVVRARTPRVAELPFDAMAKMMATEHQTANGARIIVKGAPEEVLRLCGSARFGAGTTALAPRLRRELRHAAESMGEDALRVLAIAVVDDAELDETATFSDLASRMTLLGLIGQLDPPRPEVKAAVASCRAAGIRPVMVTGDHKATGLAIAKALNIAREGDLALDGAELERLSDAELSRKLQSVSVFARVHPAQKLRIVEAYQKQREVVAMTGDGVNDAPALVKADVGVAMGITGTDVAKDAAKIVIGDDNFATIVAAVEEGRVVYGNIRKAVLLLLSTSAAEVMVLLLAMSFGYAPPFAAVQILWNNLVTEGLITVNLVMDPPEGDEMQRSPNSPEEPLLDRASLSRLLVIVPAIVVATLGWFVWRAEAGVPIDRVRTETFTLLALCEWFNVLNCRSEYRSALSLDIVENRWLMGGLFLGNALQVAVIFWAPLGRLFHTVPLGFTEVVALGAVASVVLWVEELRKLVVRRRRPRPSGLGGAFASSPRVQ